MESVGCDGMQFGSKGEELRQPEIQFMWGHGTMVCDQGGRVFQRTCLVVATIYQPCSEGVIRAAQVCAQFHKLFFSSLVLVTN